MIPSRTTTIVATALSVFDSGFATHLEADLLPADRIALRIKITRHANTAKHRQTTTNPPPGSLIKVTRDNRAKGLIAMPPTTMTIMSSNKS